MLLLPMLQRTSLFLTDLHLYSLLGFLEEEPLDQRLLFLCLKLHVSKAHENRYLKMFVPISVLYFFTPQPHYTWVFQHVDPFIPQDFGTCCSIHSAWNINISEDLFQRCLLLFFDLTFISQDGTFLLCLYHYNVLLDTILVSNRASPTPLSPSFTFEIFLVFFFLNTFLYLNFVKPTRY